MLIHLNTTDQDVVNRVYEEIQRVSPDSTIHTNPALVHQYVPGTNQHVLTSGVVEMPEGLAAYRWVHLYMSSLGGRLWVESKDDVVPSPYIAGSINDVYELRRIIVDAQFAEGKAAYYRSFGVNYLGRVNADPRVMILLDNKKDKTLSPSSNEDIFNILETYPESDNPEVATWGNLALVSSGNVDKLEAFMDYLSETNVLAYTTGGFSKLNYMGRDFGKISAPRHDPKYGIEIRNAASLMRPELPQPEIAQ